MVMRRQLKRRYVLAFFEKLPPCLVGIEACASSHYWSRELQTLGHTVRVMPPAYVKPYVKRQKNDSTDAEAICEAVRRPNMRFVPTKTPAQQGCLMLHRARHLFIRQQTAVINSIRAYLAEFGIVVLAELDVDGLVAGLPFIPGAPRQPRQCTIGPQQGAEGTAEKRSIWAPIVIAAPKIDDRVGAFIARSPAKRQSPQAPLDSSRPTLPRDRRHLIRCP